MHGQCLTAKERSSTTQKQLNCVIIISYRIKKSRGEKMLKNRNNDFFHKKGIDSQGVVFFIQQWMELFDDRTIDTYQYSISNVVYSIKEMLGVIDKTLDGRFTTSDNVEVVRAELLRIVGEDYVLQHHFPALKGRLLAHMGVSLEKGKDDKSGRAVLLRTKQELIYSLSLLEQKYFKQVVADLEKSISNADFATIYQLNKILGSYAISLGWTPKGLLDLLNSTILNGNADLFEKKWSRFIGNLTKDEDYSVYIHVPVNTVNAKVIEEVIDLYGQLGLQVFDYQNIVDQNSDIPQRDIPAKREKKYIKFILSAKDVYNAAAEAIQELNTKITILAFYNKVTGWSLSDIKGFVIAEERRYIKQFNALEIYKTNMNFQTENRIFTRIISMFANEQFVGSSVGSALIGVYNYTNIGSMSVFPEERFMNLWIALESVMRTGQYPNVIAHIKEVLPAIMCKRYIYRIVRNFAEDCQRCGVSLKFDKIEVDVGNFKESKEEMARRMISVLRDDVERGELKVRCKDNFLLLYRLDEIAAILKDNVSVIQRLRRYSETVSWHIQRLYRIRNEIAHSALQKDGNLLILTEHLYDYLAVLISEIIYAGSESGIEDINTIYPFLKDNYDAFNSIYTSKKQMLISEFVLKNGIIDYLNQKEVQA